MLVQKRFRRGRSQLIIGWASAIVLLMGGALTTLVFTQTTSCTTFVFSPPSATFDDLAHASSVACTTSPTPTNGVYTGCAWTATSNVSWVTLTGTTASDVTGTGTVPYSITANSGAPRTGTITFTTGAYGSANYTISQGSSTSVVIQSPASLTAGTVGAAYGPVTFMATGGTGSAYTFSASGLPAGLAISSSGVLSGTPAAGSQGSYTPAFTAKDSSGTSSGPVSYSLTINAAGGGGGSGATITSISPSSSIPGGPGFTLTVNGTGFALIAGTAPSIQWNGSALATALVSSTQLTAYVPPILIAVPGTAIVTVAEPGGLVSNSVAFSIAGTALEVVTTSLPGITLGASYSQALQASGGVPPYTWSYTGNLPNGLALSSAGVISGTAISGGTFLFTVKVTDSASNSTTATLAIGVGTNVLTVAPLNLSFTAQQNDTSEPSQTISVFTTTGGSFSVSYSSDANWLTATPAVGQSPGTVTVSVKPGGVSPGKHSGSVTITGTGTAPSSVTVQVGLTVQAFATGTQLSINPGFVNVSATAGSGVQQGELSVFNLGSGTLNWTATQSGASQSWLSVAASGTASPASPGIAAFQINPAGLATGTYTANVQVSAGGQTQGVPVTLVVSAGSETVLLSQTGLQFESVAPALKPPPSQQFAVLNAGSASMSWAASVCTYTGNGGSCAQGNSWLSATPTSGISASGSANSVVTVSVNPVGLAAGQYFGSVQIASAGASNTPQAVGVLLNVLPAGQTPPPLATPGGAIFVATTGSANPEPQTILLGNPGATAVTFNSTVSTQGAQDWLTQTPTSGTIGAGAQSSLSLSVNAGGIGPGTQQGTVWVAFSDGTVREIDVTLVVTSTNACIDSLVITPTGAVTPNASLVSGTAANLQVQIADGCNGTLYTATSLSVEATFSNGDPPLSLAADQGVWETTWAPGPSAIGAVTISVFAAAKSGTNAVAGSILLPVTVAQNTYAQLAQPAAVLNAASYPLAQNGQSPNIVTPGSWVSVFGAQMADQPAGPVSPLQTSLGNVSVIVGGSPLLLDAVSPTQANAVVPWGLSPGPNTLYVIRDGTQSDYAIPVTVVNAQPGIFTINQQGSGQGAVLLANTGTIAGPGAGQQAAARGSYIEIFCTGLGAVTNQPADGAPAPSSPPAETQSTPQVTIGGVTANVTFSGLAPGFLGLYQVNVQVPTGAPTGSAVPIVMTIGNVSSAANVTIAVQ